MAGEGTALGSHHSLSFSAGHWWTYGTPRSKSQTSSTFGHPPLGTAPAGMKHGRGDAAQHVGMGGLPILAMSPLPGRSHHGREQGAAHTAGVAALPWLSPSRVGKGLLGTAERGPDATTSLLGSSARGIRFGDAFQR